MSQYSLILELAFKMQANITLYVNQLSKSIDSEPDAFQIDIFAAVYFLNLLFCGLVLGAVVCF